LVEGVGKTIQVIEAFDDDHVRLTTSELAKRTGLTRPAARRYLLSLCHYGYADTDGKQFWLLPRVMRLGQSYLSSARLPRLVQPVIQRASVQSGETVSFSVLDGHDIVYLARSTSNASASIGFQVGLRMPAHVVAPGIALLSTLSDELLDEWIATHVFHKFTEKTVTDPVLFRSMVIDARQRDYWVGEQQGSMGLFGIAVVAKDTRGVCKGAVGMTLQIPESVEKHLTPILREAALSLRSLL
jgi:IclR family pca regulon transcriptional regulator